MSISEILSWVIFAISFLSGVLATLIPYIKNANAKKKLEKTVQALSGFETIISKIQPLVVKAEQFASYSGVEKKEYVMTQLKIFALENSLTFDEDTISAKVEEVVATTNQVNVCKENVSRETIVETTEKNDVQTTAQC